MNQVTVPGTGECFDLDRPGQVAAWNRALNRRFGMQNLRAHPNRIVRWIEARRRRRVAAMVPAGFDRAIDVGAEDGSLATLWRSKGRFTLLLDVDPGMLRDAAGAGAVADAVALPLADASVDVIVLSAVLEHLLEPERAVAESLRVLRPGGRLVIYVPWDRAAIALKRWARRIGVGLGKLSEGSAPGHLRTFDRRSLSRLLANAGPDVRTSFDPFSLGYYAEVRR